MKKLDLDIETFSSTDLAKCGIYKYAESPDAALLLISYSIDGGPIITIDIAQGETIPDEILAALTDDSVIKWAHNSAFERIFLSVWISRNYPQYFRPSCVPETTLRNYLNPASWCCSQIWCAYLGLPLSLENAGTVLDLEELKLQEGKDLIRRFCMPCAFPEAPGGWTRNLPQDAPDQWELFKQYNRRDVKVEMSIQTKLQKFPVPDFIWEEYRIDQEINDRGIALDLDLIKNAIRFDELSRAAIVESMKKMTGLENPNSTTQMKKWLANKGIHTNSLDKNSVENLLLQTVPPDIAGVLTLWKKLSKSSTAKYTTMARTACSDGRARGMFQFYGAARTGRWAGRLIQLQNLPRNSMSDLENARSIVKSGDYNRLCMIFEDIPDTLSQLIRTAFIPKTGCKLIIADFSAIEARVLAWLAGETWRMNAFTENQDIYCASASRMFGVPVEKNGRNSELRQKGKIAELALGYGGSVGALRAMGALNLGLREEELQPLVSTWRAANPNITRLWWEVDRAAIESIQKGTITESHGIRFSYQIGPQNMLSITLPSGRNLCYINPSLYENKYNCKSIRYEGVGSKKWEQQETYGPKLIENIVQGLSRDILAYSMKSLENYRIVGHIHDELIIECSEDTPIESICSQMSRMPVWAQGLQLCADGFETEYYKKI